MEHETFSPHCLQFFNMILMHCNVSYFLATLLISVISIVFNGSCLEQKRKGFLTLQSLMKRKVEHIFKKLLKSFKSVKYFVRLSEILCLCYTSCPTYCFAMLQILSPVELFYFTIWFHHEQKYIRLFQVMYANRDGPCHQATYATITLTHYRMPG